MTRDYEDALRLALSICDQAALAYEDEDSPNRIRRHLRKALGPDRIEGFRVTPPTHAEVMHQHALGRGWRTEDIRGSVQHLRGSQLSESFLSGKVPLRWWSEDAEHRACAWPRGGSSS